MFRESGPSRLNAVNRSLSSPLFVLLIFLLAMGSAHARDKIEIRIWLFQVTHMEEEQPRKEPEVLSISLDPEFAAIRDYIKRPPGELKNAIVDNLMEIRNLRKVEELFLFERTWDGSSPMISDSMIGSQLAFLVNIYPMKLALPQFWFRLTISKTKDGILRTAKDERAARRNAYQATRDEDKMEGLADREVHVIMGEPVITGFASQTAHYYMIVLVEEEKKQSAPDLLTEVNVGQASFIQQAPRSTREVRPFYPETLRERGVKGEVGLRLTIDAKGAVRRVEIRESLYPYLDYCAMSAFKQWLFEPVAKKGKATGATFDYSFRFDPMLHYVDGPDREEIRAASEQSHDIALQEILEGCRDYSRKLAEQALYFICEEAITIVHHQLKPLQILRELIFRQGEVIWEDPVTGGRVVYKGSVQIMDPSQSERKRYVCDYQFVRKNGEIEEQRLLLKEDGRSISGRSMTIEEERLSPFTFVFVAERILAFGRQESFEFRILRKERTGGRMAVVLDAFPRSGNADGVLSARLWVDQKDHRILKTEIFGVPIEGYDDVLKDAILLNIEPRFVTTHEYQMERDGVLLPTHVKVRIEYPGIRRSSLETKARLDQTYKKWKFFGVETSHEIIK